MCKATTTYPHCDKTDETTELSFNNTSYCTVASITDTTIKPIVTNTINNNKQLIQYTDDYQDQSQTATSINLSINNSDVHVMNDPQYLNNSTQTSPTNILDTVGVQTINVPYKDVAVQTSVSEETQERFKMSASTQTHVDSELHVLALSNNVRYPVPDTISCLSPDDKKDLIKVFVDNCDSIVSILTSKLPDISDDKDAIETLESIEKKMDTIRTVTDSITNKLVYHCLMSKLK